MNLERDCFCPGAYVRVYVFMRTHVYVFFVHARARMCVCARACEHARTPMHVCMHARAMPRGEQIEPVTCCIGSFCACFLLPANSKTVLLSAFAGDSLVCCLMPVTCGLL